MHQPPRGGDRPEPQLDAQGAEVAAGTPFAVVDDVSTFE
jgi:hypothetical protein